MPEYILRMLETLRQGIAFGKFTSFSARGRFTSPVCLSAGIVRIYFKTT